MTDAVTSKAPVSGTTQLPAGSKPTDGATLAGNFQTFLTLLTTQLQAQNPLDPYLSLWSRLDRFDPDAVGRLVEDRTLVRIVVMRGTIHLVTAADACTLRPLTQPVLDAEIARHSEYAKHLVGVDMAPVLAFAHPLLSEQPMAGSALRPALAERFPELHAAALAYACRCLLPLVQVPPRGVWGRTLQVRSTPLDAWVGHPLDPAPSIDEVVLRYLAAFGPGCGSSTTSGAVSSTTSRMVPGPERRCRRRCASCPSTTTSAWPTPSARACPPG